MRTCCHSIYSCKQIKHKKYWKNNVCRITQLVVIVGACDGCGKEKGRKCQFTSAEGENQKIQYKEKEIHAQVEKERDGSFLGRNKMNFI